MEEAIILKEKSRRSNKKYSTEEIELEAKLDVEQLPEECRYVSASTVVSLVERLFDAIKNHVIRGLSPQDLVRFIMINEKLDKPASTGLVRVDHVTVDTLMDSFMKVLQSKTKVLLDEKFTIDAIAVRRPTGSGRARAPVNIEIDRLLKHSILSIENEKDFPHICCAKAIVLAKAVADQHPDVRCFMNKESCLLLRRALALHTSAGVPEGPCGYEEVTTFANHLDIQIAVFCTSPLLQVKYFNVYIF